MTKKTKQSTTENISHSSLNTKINFIPSFFDTNDISNFKSCNVVYIGVVGISDNELLCKYGKTSDIKTRLYNHTAVFGENFTLIFVGKTNNCNVVENEFRDLIKSKNLNKTMVFNNENKTELFLTNNEFTLDKAKETMIKLIQNHPTDELKKLETINKNHDQLLAIEIEKTKQEEEKRKTEEEKRKTVEAKIELEKEKNERIKNQLNLIEENKKKQIIVKNDEKKEENEDIYFQFLNEKTKVTTDINDRIHLTDLYEIFKIWFKEKNGNANIPSNKKFAGNLRKYKIIKKTNINEKISNGILFIKLLAE